MPHAISLQAKKKRNIKTRIDYTMFGSIVRASTSSKEEIESNAIAGHVLATAERVSGNSSSFLSNPGVWDTPQLGGAWGYSNMDLVWMCKQKSKKRRSRPAYARWLVVSSIDYCACIALVLRY